MADVDQAVQFVLRQEDSRLTGVISTLPGDRGGATRFGLASKFHPELLAKGYYEVKDGVPTIPHDEALAIAKSYYRDEYASPLRLAQIGSQDVSNRLLSFAINEGVPEAAMLAQRALISLSFPLKDDGKVGPITLKAINCCHASDFIAAESKTQVAFYEQMVIDHPNLMPYREQFLSRART
jgi:lysozyme family protein